MQAFDGAVNLTSTHTQSLSSQRAFETKEDQENQDFDLSDSFSAFLCAFDPFTQQEDQDRTSTLLKVETCSAKELDNMPGTGMKSSFHEEQIDVKSAHNTSSANIVNFDALAHRVESEASSVRAYENQVITQDNLLQKRAHHEQSTVQVFEENDHEVLFAENNLTEKVSHDPLLQPPPSLRTASLSPALLLTQLTSALQGTLIQHPLKPHMLEVQLIPAELGVIHIKINTESRAPSLAFSGSPETLALIKTHAGSLIQNLSHQGVTLAQADLSFEHQEQGFNDRDKSMTQESVHPPPPSKLKHAFSSFEKLRKGLFA